MKKSFLPLLLGWVLTGCAATGQEVVITAKNNGQTLRIPVGGTLVVRLAANPTTGYDWTPASVAAPVVNLVGTSFTSAGAPGMTGAGGTDTFHFRAVKPGEEVLKLNYARSWETNVPPVQTVSFTIKVGR